MKESMKIDYVTDLHINHWIPFQMNQLKWEKRTRDFVKRLLRKGNGEVLLLGGDFSEMNTQTLWVFDECAKHYERVYWTFGNHDLYLLSKNDNKKYKHHSLNRVQELIEKTAHLENVVPLVKSVETYKGITFAGDALWYLPKTLQDWEFYKNVSKDSSYIHHNEAWGMEDVARLLYKGSADWYDTLEGQEIDVMLTHVPPVHPKLSQYPANAIYHSPVPYLSANHWVCGHDHLQGTFEKAGTHFYMNAIGYPDAYEHVRAYEVPGDNVDPVLTLDVMTLEIPVPSHSQ